MRMKAAKGQNRGFTLVELIVVLTVLGMLLAILVPQLLGYVDEAKMDAEYSAGECCRLAAQAKLDALAYRQTEPDYNSAGKKASVTNAEQWHSVFAEPVLQMTGQEVRNLFIATGQYQYYEGIKNTAPAYRVYYVVCQRAEDAPVVYYNGEEWVQDSPWASMPANATVDGDSVVLQFFCVKCETDEAHGTPQQVLDAMLNGTY